jgi:predicted O-methyltransferase YrrM
MAFLENWFAKPKRLRLHDAMLRVPKTNGAIVEVGSWEGRSTIDIARFFPEDSIHVIDHWLGDSVEANAKNTALAASRDVYSDFIENVKEAGVYDRLIVHRMGWREALDPSRWLDPISFIFIDAEHTYHEVKDNILRVLPLMVSGGIIAGDDYTTKEVEQATKDTLGEVKVCKGPGRSIWRWRAP